MPEIQERTKPIFMKKKSRELILVAKSNLIEKISLIILSKLIN